MLSCVLINTYVIPIDHWSIYNGIIDGVWIFYAVLCLMNTCVVSYMFLIPRASMPLSKMRHNGAVISLFIKPKARHNEILISLEILWVNLFSAKKSSGKKSNNV